MVLTRATWLAVLAGTLLAYGCLQVSPQPPLPATSMSSWGPLGGFTVSSGATCAGQTTLNAGVSTVTDPCFTGPENIVMCTDTTAANPVKCAPDKGTLSVAGTSGDTISYVRLR